MNPKVRIDLGFHPISHQGQSFFRIEDPYGLVDEGLCVTDFAGFLLSMMDGKHSIESIQARLVGMLDGSLPKDFVSEQVQLFRELGLLESEELNHRRNDVIDQFCKSPHRSSSHQGQGYPEDPDELEDWIEEILSISKGPSLSSPPRLLVAPHIDFRVNTSLYGKVYALLRGYSYDRVILLGTGHTISEGIYCVSGKTFQTPLGSTPSDSKVVAQLASLDTPAISPNDYPHRKEHALEFQLIFLQYLLGPNHFELVPILCGSVHPYLKTVSSLEDIHECQPVISLLQSLVQDTTQKTLVVAGIDFSHIGLRFGHQEKAEEISSSAKSHDQGLIAAFCQGDKKRFWSLESETNGFFNVCGFTTLATVMEIFPEMTASCLGYDYWDDSPTGSAVSFASLIA